MQDVEGRHKACPYGSVGEKERDTGRGRAGTRPALAGVLGRRRGIQVGGGQAQGLPLRGCWGVIIAD